MLAIATGDGVDYWNISHLLHIWCMQTKSNMISINHSFSVVDLTFVLFIIEELSIVLCNSYYRITIMINM